MAGLSFKGRPDEIDNAAFCRKWGGLVFIANKDKMF